MKKVMLTVFKGTASSSCYYLCVCYVCACELYFNLCCSENVASNQFFRDKMK